jgi:hypothetical protein
MVKIADIKTALNSEATPLHGAGFVVVGVILIGIELAFVRSMTILVSGASLLGIGVVILRGR